MIGTIYRITTADGRVVEGRVQGSGGMLGGAGPKQTPRHAKADREYLQMRADRGDDPDDPKQGVWRVFPLFCANGNGPHVDIDIRGATVEIVDIDTDEKPSLGWPRERVKLAWRHLPRVRVDTLKRGDVFFSSEGDAWRYVRPDGASSGAHHVESIGGDTRSSFAGCAEVLKLSRRSNV